MDRKFFVCGGTRVYRGGISASRLPTTRYGEVCMRTPFSAFYGFHMLVQAIVSLLSPPALLTLLAWYLHTRHGVGEWIYAVLVFFGLITGFYSMIRYLLAASAHSKAIEKQEEDKKKKQKNNEHKL